MKKIITTLMLAVGLLAASCGHLKYVPIETGTTVHVIDSVAIHYLDSIRIYEATRYRDMSWMTDTLRIYGARSSMWAYADTTKEVLVGSLEEDKVEEKTKIVYKDKLVYRDSIQTKEVPVPVEVVKEVKVIPRFYRIFAIIGVALSCLLLIQLFIFIKKKFPV